jgi:hypothetical protein
MAKVQNVFPTSGPNVESTNTDHTSAQLKPGAVKPLFYSGFYSTIDGNYVNFTSTGTQCSRFELSRNRLIRRDGECRVR